MSIKESKKLFKKKIKEAAEHRLPPLENNKVDHKLVEAMQEYAHRISSVSNPGPIQFIPRSMDSGYQGNQGTFRGTPGPIVANIREEEFQPDGLYITLRIPDVINNSYRDVRLTHEQYRRLVQDQEIPTYVESSRAISNRLFTP